MKKFFSFIAIALLVMVLAVPAFAAADIVAYGGGSGLNTVKTITLINTDTVTGNTCQETNISTTAYFIPTKCKLLGYSAQIRQTAGLDGRFAIEDSTSSTTGDTDTMIIAESETQSAYPVSVFYPDGIRLTRGLTVKQWPMTVVTIYYIQDRP